MTNVAELPNSNQDCGTSQSGQTAQMPCAGSNAVISLAEGNITSFDFSMTDIKGMILSSEGALVITFNDGQTLTVSDFAEAAQSGNYPNIQMADGDAVAVTSLYESLGGLPMSQQTEQNTATLITKPVGAIDATALAFSLKEGETYQADFAQSDIASSKIDDQGNMVILFNDGTQITLQNYAQFEGGALSVPSMTLADGSVIPVTDLLVAVSEVNSTYTLQVEDLVTNPQQMSVDPLGEEETLPVAEIMDTPQEMAMIQPNAGDMDPRALAAIEPAAGTAPAQGALGNTGAGFGSTVNGINLSAVNAIGPIGPTSLQFSAPIPTTENGPIIAAIAAPPTVTFGTAGSGSAEVHEDGSVFVPITATLGGGANEQLTVTLTGVPSTWTVTTGPSNGTYDSATGTWTITLPAGTNYDGGLTFAPPADSDVDLTGLTVTATARDTNDNDVASVSTDGEIIVDAVADAPTLNASPASSNVTQGNSIDLNISGGVTDVDGSETLSSYTISGLPTGYSLSAGTETVPGTWVVTEAELAGLQLNTPADQSGTLTLTVSVSSIEGVTDTDFDLTNNEETTTVDFQLTIDKTFNPPSVTYGAGGSGSAEVLEDGTVFVPITATLDGNAPQILTVTVSNIPSTWTVVTGAGNGTYDSGTGTWTITLPQDQDYNGGLTFTPPANSDVDLSGLTVTADALNLDTNATLDSTTSGEVIVDAVADPVNLTATDESGLEDNAVALNIQTSLIDTDGSETITEIRILDVPAGFTLNHGTNMGGGEWVVSIADLATLELTAPEHYSGSVPLRVQVTNEETNTSDTEFDLTNNTNTTTTDFTVTFAPVPDAPSLTVNNPQVKEDGTIDLNFSATLIDKDGSESLTVRVSNIDPTWTINTGPSNGTYDAATGTWTITLPAGQDYSGSLNFTPPADSDVDMTNIIVSATSTESDGTTVTNTANVEIVVDAVADMPILDVDPISGQSGTSYALNITNALTDTDGSESLGDVTISGIPAGFSLSAGTESAPGTWVVSQADLAGLQLNTPNGFDGNFSLEVSVTSTDTPSDDEFDTTDNTATATVNVDVSLNISNAHQPTVTIAGSHEVLEDGTVFVPFTANLGAGALGSEILSVTLTGVPSTWTVTTGAANGTYDAATGTWTIMMPAGEDYNGGLTFAPPADSDVDLSGLTLTATATQPTNGSTSTANANSEIIVDAVADAPTLNAGDINGAAGSSIPLNISNAVTDTDGSESLGDVTISGLPAGYSLSAGTETAAGTWVVSQADLAGLQLNVPASGVGTFSLSVSVTSTEGVTDTDFDLTNNTATATDTFDVTVTNNATPPTVNIAGSHQVLEDGSVFVPIEASLNGGDPTEVLTVTLTGVAPGWTVTTGAANGSYNSATGTWTITMPAGTNYSGGLTFAPPANSDVDLTGLTLTATSTQPQTGETVSNSAPSSVIVDAVADAPTLNVNNANGLEGNPVPLVISSALTDTDGSESLSNVTISGLPAGFSLNKGTEVANGTWELTQADLSGLRLLAPATYSGSVALNVSVTSTEGVTDTDFDLTNNSATTTKVLNVAIANLPNTPTLDVAGTHEVYEDGSVFVPIKATLTGTGDEILTVSVSGIGAGWTVTTGANNGTYNSATGTWTFTLPAGTNYDGGITLAPPADSDLDLDNVSVKANAFLPSANQNVSITEIVQVVTDAVADTPIIDSVNSASVVAGNAVALNVTNSLTDTDGSESLGSVRVSGVPDGYSLSAGTKQANGTWLVNQADLAGLNLVTPANASKTTVNLTFTVTSTESVSDDEFDLSNNTASASSTTTINVGGTFEEPEVGFGTPGPISAAVYEDNSVFVPITGTLNGTADQILTVTVSGIPSDWTVETGAGNGTYNAATGTWTITMAPNTDYNGGLTFTPPADSDIDLDVVTVSAVSENVDTGDTLTDTTEGRIVVDAVADTPIIDSVNSASVVAGNAVALNVTNAVTDTDGSESLGRVRVSGVPDGYSLSSGTKQSGGDWLVNQADLAGLQLVTPANASKTTINLTFTVTSTDRETDSWFDDTNNTASASSTTTINVGGSFTPPDVTFGAGGSGSAQVLEDGSVSVPITATLNGTADQILTVTVSGIPSDWTIATGANNGTYNAATGTWTITLPQGQDYNGNLRFSPPANSDVDLTGLVVTATSKNVDTNATLSDTTNGQVIVDAVADTPIIDSANSASVVAGNSVALNVTNSLTDTDGSESLGQVRVSGVPNGYSLSAGTKQANGDWLVNQSDLASLKLVTPASATDRDINLTFTVTSTESVSDDEFDLSNNTASASSTTTINVGGSLLPPDVTFGAGGSGSAQVLEDGSVSVPITATLNGTADQILTVTVSGIPSSWTIATGANNGTYNAATGTWTITLPQGQDYNGNLRFSPPANSDVDLTGLVVTATSKNVDTNATLSDTTNGQVIVDAVADTPTLHAQNASGEEGTSVPIYISAAPYDRDGSETLGKITISDVPNGFTFNKGTQVSANVWEFTQTQLSGLRINMPDGKVGSYTLRVSVTTTEGVTDGEFNNNNNTATTTKNITLVVNPDDVPVITTPNERLSKESNLDNPNVITGNVNADFGSDNPGEFFIKSANGFSATGNIQGNGLSSGGVEVNVVAKDGNTYIGWADGKKVFELTLTSSGSYEFTQYKPLDHSKTGQSDEIINLRFDIWAKDSDGDEVSTKLVVKVEDTAHVAKDDVINMWSCDWITLGNVITGHNEKNNGSDNLSPENPALVTSVTFKGDTYDFKGGGQGMVVHGEHGDLFMFTNGSYAYVSFESNPKASHGETFRYTLVDGDGDKSTAKLDVNVIVASVSNNDASDYGLYYNGTNTRIDGQAAYKTNDEDGAIVYSNADSGNYVLSGNSGDDVIRGWLGNDTLYGARGNDVLIGAVGKNNLYGGAGADIFWIDPDKAGNDNIFDVIHDFNLDEGDVIVLNDVISGFGRNDDINDFVKLVQDGNQLLLKVNSDGRGNDFDLVAKIKNHADLPMSSLTVDDLFQQGYLDVA